MNALKSKSYDEIHRHPGKQAHDKWENLLLTYKGIYLENKKEINSLLDAPNHNNDLLIELMQNVKPQTVRKKYEYATLRSLHNYIASSFTLVDHSRRFIKEYIGSSFEKEYSCKTKDVASSVEHQFMQGLRNYIIHFDVPPLGWIIKIYENDNESFQAVLDIETLLNYTKWTSETKRYFGGHQSENIIISEIIEAHGKSIDQLYTWIFQQFEALHGKDIDAVNNLIKTSGLLLRDEALNL